MATIVAELEPNFKKDEVAAIMVTATIVVIMTREMLVMVEDVTITFTTKEARNAVLVGNGSQMRQQLYSRKNGGVLYHNKGDRHCHDKTPVTAIVTMDMIMFIIAEDVATIIVTYMRQMQPS